MPIYFMVEGDDDDDNNGKRTIDIATSKGKRKEWKQGEKREQS